MTALPTADALHRIQLDLKKKYSNSLYFYLAKEVNQHIRTRNISKEVALLRDFSYWDYQEEFLKRYYTFKEVPQRIHLLEDYFRHTRPLPEEMPRVLPHRELLFKRIKRRIKLTKKLQEHPSGRPVGFRDEEFLVDLPSEELAENMQRSRNIQEVSFESEAYDIYADNDSSVEGGETEEQRPLSLGKLPTLKLIVDEEEDPEEQISYQDVASLVVDFTKLPPKRPLLQLNLPAVKPHNKVYYDQPVESRELSEPREQVIRQLRPSKYHISNQYEPMVRQVKSPVAEKKVYLVKGLRQRQNHDIAKGEAQAYQQYFSRKKQKEDQNNLHPTQHQNNHRMFKTGRVPGSRLDDLREKLKSLESRSSSLSQRISTLMTERQTKKKVDYAELMARVKGAGTNSQTKQNIRSPPFKTAKQKNDYERGEPTLFSNPFASEYIVRGTKLRTRDMAQTFDLYPDD